MAPWGEAALPRCHDQTSATQQANLHRECRISVEWTCFVQLISWWLLFSIHVHCFSLVNHHKCSSQHISKSFIPTWYSIFRSFGNTTVGICWRLVVSPHSPCSRSGDRSPNTARGGQRFSRVPVEHEISCGNWWMNLSAVGMTICMIDSWYHFILLCFDGKHVHIPETMYKHRIKRSILRHSYTKINYVFTKDCRVSSQMLRRKCFMNSQVLDLDLKFLCCTPWHVCFGRIGHWEHWRFHEYLSAIISWCTTWFMEIIKHLHL